MIITLEPLTLTALCSLALYGAWRWGAHVGYDQARGKALQQFMTMLAVSLDSVDFTMEQISDGSDDTE